MCVCENKKASRFFCDRRDFNDETTCDVVFLVGREPDVCRFTAHRAILKKGTPVFKAMFNFTDEPAAKVIRIEDVDNRSFDYLLRFLYGKEIGLQTYWTALALLYTAHKYLVPELVEICVKYLIQSLTEKSVLEVYQHARRYINETQPNHRKNNENYAPSAPMEFEFETQKIVLYSKSLLTNCENYIDKNADKVFQTEQFDELDGSSLCALLSRDSLMITNELTVFNALLQWSLVECRRRHLPVTAVNRRNVLGDSLLLVRYGLLSSKDFSLGPIQSDLFNREELRFLASLIDQPAHLPFVPQQFRPFVGAFCKPRGSPMVADPVWSLKSISWKKTKSKEKPKLERSVSLDSGKSCAAKSWAANACVDLLLCLFD